MSTDFDIVCDRCRQYRHCGQIMASIPSFGHGSTDDAGRCKVAEFAFEHAFHGDGVRVIASQSAASDRICDAYTNLDRVEDEAT